MTRITAANVSSCLPRVGWRPVTRAAVLILAGVLPLCVANGANIIITHLPDELVAASDVVCNGIPLGVVPAKGKGRLRSKNGALSRVRVSYNEARVRVIGRFKGEVPAEIRFRYAVLNPDDDMIDGPFSINVNPGTRYRFYLKAPSAAAGGCYVGVFDGVYNDRTSVEQLGVQEANDSPPLLKARAFRLATAYVRKYYHRPSSGNSIMPLTEYYGSPDFAAHWEVYFALGSPHPDWLMDAIILLDATGEILRGSWVAAGPPVRRSDGLQRFEGKPVLVEAIGQQTGHFQGRVAKVDRTAISGTFVDEVSGKSKPMAILMGNVESVRELASPPQ